MEEAVQYLRSARRVVLLTGAGISKESGLDTFRDSEGDGIWSRYNPMELATPQAFNKDPELVWKWYNWRREKAFKAMPNAGHEVLAEWENQYPEFLLVTQNVDGLHQRAGSRKIVCLHGNLLEVRCLETDRVLNRLDSFKTVPPFCHCGSMLRPHIVWFGEALYPGTMETAINAVKNADILVVVGTSLAVYPAASMVPYAINEEIPVIEINPEKSDFSNHTIFLKGESGTILPNLQKALSD
tara:strand:+ start:461 stop:1183 length:723 start_codon:yes stop_codon:yes gene_type:complete